MSKRAAGRVEVIKDKVRAVIRLFQKKSITTNEALKQLLSLEKQMKKMASKVIVTDKLDIKFSLLAYEHNTRTESQVYKVKERIYKYANIYETGASMLISKTKRLETQVQQLSIQN